MKTYVWIVLVVLVIGAVYYFYYMGDTNQLNILRKKALNDGQATFTYKDIVYDTYTLKPIPNG